MVRSHFLLVHHRVHTIKSTGLSISLSPEEKQYFAGLFSLPLLPLFAIFVLPEEESHRTNLEFLFSPPVFPYLQKILIIRSIVQHQYRINWLMFLIKHSNLITTTHQVHYLSSYLMGTRNRGYFL